MNLSNLIVSLFYNLLGIIGVSVILASYKFMSDVCRSSQEN